ncbi:MFS transporter [Arsenicibacter rosenii]|uniref:MFS transporter n=1 Tax=Arsenicibacter rosenii TaxID=1750698 RepID=A0A1S2VKB6_9BACT|nr:MFS transporter [Arsenicibacter rosenii]OIN59202.1 MFS transporter [Arsenicibacter rosenii]
MIARTLRLYRNAYTGLAPSVWLLSGVMLINRCGTMVLPYLTLYLTQHLHFSVSQAGVVMAVYGTGAFVGTFLGGKLTDRFGFYYVQLISLFAGGVFLLGLQYVSNFYAICASAFIFTLLGDTFRPANSAAIAHYSHADNRTRAYSLNRLAINLGWSVGGGLGGYLASIDYSLLFWADGFTCIAAAAVLRFFLPPPARVATGTKHATATTEVSPAQSPYKDRYFLGFTGCTLLYAISFLLLFSLIPLYFKEKLLLDESQIGMLLALNGILIVIIEMALVYTIEQKFAHHKTLIICTGVLLTGFSYLVLLITPLAGIALVFTIITTFGEMLTHPFLQSFAVSRSTPQTRGQYLALHSMAFALAQVTSPALGSLIVTTAGFGLLWTVMMGLCLVSATGYWWLSRRFA